MISNLPYILVYKSNFLDVKMGSKIDLDLYSGEHETYLPNHKKNAKIHCNKPSYGVK